MQVGFTFLREAIPLLKETNCLLSEKEMHLNEREMHLTEQETHFMEPKNVKVANTHPKRGRIPLFTGVLKNQHPPQHSPQHPTITHPRAQPDDLLFEVPRFQRLNFFPMSWVEWQVECRLGVTPTPTPAFPLYIKVFQAIGVGVGLFSQNSAKIQMTVQRQGLLRANYRFGLSEGSLVASLTSY